MPERETLLSYLQGLGLDGQRLSRYLVVGVLGYLVLLGTFWLLRHALSFGPSAAAAGAFLASITNNFVWNRQWTFQATTSPVRGQAARYLVISLTLLLVSLVLFRGLLAAGVPDLLATAIAGTAVIPLNFVLQRRWSFRI